MLGRAELGHAPGAPSSNRSAEPVTLGWNWFDSADVMRSQRGGERSDPCMYSGSLVAAEEARPRAEEAVETRARSLVAASRLVDEGGLRSRQRAPATEREKRCVGSKGVNTGKRCDSHHCKR